MWAALVLGLAGSFHCVAMCGPLMMALPLSKAQRTKLFGQLLIYNSGRILIYTLLGLVMGIIGQNIWLAGFQKYLSILAGVALLTFAILPKKAEQWIQVLPGMRALYQFVQINIRRLIHKNSAGALFTLGALNGMVPCGLVYAALAGAIASGLYWQGALFMLFFGLGTLPLILFSTIFGQNALHFMRSYFKPVQPILIAAIGLLLIYRAWHLDLNLFMSAVPQAAFDCH